MKSILLTLPLLFSAAAFANDTSYPSIQFDTGVVSEVEGMKKTLKVDLKGGQADKLYDVLATPFGAGPKEYYERQRGLVLLGKNKAGESVYISLHCNKGEWDFEKNRFVLRGRTDCSVYVSDAPYESDLHEYNIPACLKK